MEPKGIAIFGYGAVGRALTQLLADRGEPVRIVQRSEPAMLPAGCTFLAADTADREATARACAGVATVVCCIGLPYDYAVWQHAWPATMSALLDGCERSGARFIFADNLYMYGPQVAPLREDMPLTNAGRKPALRAALTRQWLEADEAHRVRCVAVRSSDFYGPAAATSVISAFGVKNMLAGQAALSPYPADNPHAFTYIPDFARALASLIDAPDSAYGQAWHVPNAPARSLREVLTLAAELARVKPRINVMPAPLRAVAGLFNVAVRETGEMIFQWDRPYHVDASKFSGTFWSDPVSLEEGLKETIASYRGPS
jgi:nucleoside-diphosphate-sugar epimerase